MQIPLNSSILYIENRLQQLSNSLASGRIARNERSRIEAKIEMATEALQEYRHAQWLEHLLRADDPDQLATRGV